MDYEKVKEFILAQRSRDPRPMNAFARSMLAVTKTSHELDNAEFEMQCKALLAHLLIPHLITIVECYFRDSLDAIFRLCKHTAYLSALNKLVKQKKYTAQEIIELEAEGLHFLQIIPREMSFQSLEQITSAYDNFITTGFVNEIKKSKFRFKDHPDSIMEVTDKTLSNLSELFRLRHDIVHNPNAESLINELPDIGVYIDIVWDFIFCANISIERFIGENIKESVKV